MAETGQFWTGETPAGYTGRGHSWVAPSEIGTTAVEKIQGAFAADKKRVADEERTRIEFGKNVDMPIEGWDTDVNRQLNTQLTDLRKYYSTMMAQGINPQDPKNSKEYQQYHNMRDRLKADMMSSTEQQGIYKDMLKKLLNDDKNVYDREASYANLAEYRAGNISQRANMADMLVPRIKTKSEAMKDIFDHFKAQTKGTSTYNADGSVNSNSLTKMPIEDMLLHVKQIYNDDQDSMGESLRKMFPQGTYYDDRGQKKEGKGYEDIEDYVRNMYQDYEEEIDSYSRGWKPETDEKSSRLQQNEARINKNRLTNINTIKTRSDGTEGTGISKVTANAQYGFDPVDISITGSENFIGMDGKAVPPSSQTYNMKVGDVQLVPVYSRDGKVKGGTMDIPKGSVVPDDVLAREKAAGNVTYEVIAFGSYEDEDGVQTSVYFPAEDISGRLVDEYVPLDKMLYERNGYNRELSRLAQGLSPDSGEVERPAGAPTVGSEQEGMTPSGTLTIEEQTTISSGIN